MKETPPRRILSQGEKAKTQSFGPEDFGSDWAVMSDIVTKGMDHPYVMPQNTMEEGGKRRDHIFIRRIESEGKKESL